MYLETFILAYGVFILGVQVDAIFKPFHTTTRPKAFFGQCYDSHIPTKPQTIENTSNIIRVDDSEQRKKMNHL